MIHNLTTSFDKKQLGNKGYNLLRLQEAGFTIPKTFVLTIELTNKYITINNGIVESIEESFFNGHLAFLQPDKKYIFRSSSAYEDNEGATFAGLFESIISVGADSMESIKKVFESYFSKHVEEYAQLKGIVLDKRTVQMAVLIQEFDVADYAGVAHVCDEGEVIEFSQSDNLGITSGDSKREIFIYDSINGKYTGSQEPLQSKLERIRNDFLNAKKQLSFQDDVLIEWKYIGEELTFLQIREHSIGLTRKSIFPKKIGWKEFFDITQKLLRKLGFKEGEWFIHETGFSLSFRHLSNNFEKKSTNRTFTIFLFVNTDDSRIQDWISVKNIDVLRVLRPKFGKESYLDDLNSELNIDFTFNIMEGYEYNYFAINGSGYIGMYDIKKDFHINIFSFYDLSTFKDFFQRNIGDAKKILKQVMYDRGIITKLLKKLGKDEEYDANLLKILLFELELNNSILEYISKNKNRVIDFREEPNQVVKGEPFIGFGIYEGIVVLKENIEGLVFKQDVNYFYVSYDFEPFYIGYINNISGMIVSRGSNLCHGVAVCQEFGIPIISGTQNIGQLKNGVKIIVDFGTGNISV